MDYKKSYLIYVGSAFACLGLALVSWLTQAMWPGVLGIVAFFVGLFQTMVFYRCPYCNKMFNIRARPPKYCPECGSKLEEP